MNCSIDAVPSNEGGRAAFDWPTEIAALRRQNQKLRAELFDTRLGLRNALQYVLLLHSHRDSACQAQHPRRPTSATSSATLNAGCEVTADPEARAVRRLQAELARAKAEMNELHWLLRTVVDGTGSVGADPKARVSDWVSVGATRRAHECRQPGRELSIREG